jgi:hypothetical protein
MKNVGIFRRKSPDHQWCRLMARGTKKHMYAFHNMYPDHEIGMFEYAMGKEFTQRDHDTMVRVYA